LAAFTSNNNNWNLSTWDDTGTGTSGGSWLYFRTSTTSTLTASTYAPTDSTTYVTQYQGGSNYTIPKAPPLPAPVVPPKIDPRIVSRYLNASDLLEEFIKDIGALGIRQSEVLAVPIELFINWLIVKSAEEDDKADEVKDIPKLPSAFSTYRRDRCRCCGRFVTAQARKMDMYFCSGEHYSKFMSRELVA
jgi:hypothetical protein